MIFLHPNEKIIKTVTRNIRGGPSVSKTVISGPLYCKTRVFRYP